MSEGCAGPAAVQATAVSDTALFRKRAPTLYAIIGLKLLKGALFMTLAIALYTLSDNDLPEAYHRLLHYLGFNPERRFWLNLGTWIGGLTEANVVWSAVLTFIYSLFSLVEGVGLIFRATWAGWMAILESMFGIPIEVYEMIHRPTVTHQFPVGVCIFFVINVAIIWYLLRNRHRLFRHHHH